MAAENRTLIFVTGIMMASLFGFAALDMPAWFIDLSKLWGPAFLLLAFGAAGVMHYVPRSVIGDFVTAQQRQAIAMSSISDSLKEMSGQAGRLDSKLDLIIAKEEEMLLDLRVGTERFKRLEEALLHESRH